MHPPSNQGSFWMWSSHAFAIHIRPFKSLELMIKIRELFGPTGVGLAHNLHNHWGPHIQLQPQGRYHRDQQQSCQLQRPQHQLGNLAPLLDIGIIGTYIIVELLGLYIQTITNLYQIRKMLWPRWILGNKKRPSLVDHAPLILHWVDPTSLVASNTWRPPYCRCSPRPFGWTLAWRCRGFFLSEDAIVLNSRQVKSIEKWWGNSSSSSLVSVVLHSIPSISKKFTIFPAILSQMSHLLLPSRASCTALPSTKQRPHSPVAGNPSIGTCHGYSYI